MMIRSSINRLCFKSIHFCAIAIAAYALLSSRANGAAYTFTRIADSSGVFRDFPPVPAINNSGTVAFLAGLDNGPPGLFVGAGLDTMKIADVAGPISQFGLAPTINAGGVVGFTALMDNGEQRVFSGIGTGAGPVTITSTSGPLRTIGAVGAIADDGRVAFAAQLDSGPGGVFRADPFGMVTISTPPGGTPPTVAQSANAIIAYQALGPAGPGIFTTAAGTGTPIVDISGPITYFADGMSVNNTGAVAFLGALDNGRRGVFLHSGGVMRTIADTSSAFVSFEFNPSPPTVNLTRPGLNDSGRVAFLARQNTGGLGIFTGPDPVADAVIKMGQTLDGGVVTNLGYYGALNDSGQLAFTAQFSNGRQGVYVASPFTGPPTWNVDAHGNWLNAANWIGGVPNAAGAEAHFGNITTAPRTVNVDFPVTAGRITFDNANTYTIAGESGIKLDTTNGIAQIEVAIGSHVIAAPLTLADHAQITVTPAGSNLTLTKPLTGPGLNLTKAGAGTLSVSDLQVARLFITNGTLMLAPNSTTDGALVLEFLSLAPEPPAAESINAVPEPLAVSLLGMAMLTSAAIIATRRRRGTQ